MQQRKKGQRCAHYKPLSYRFAEYMKTRGTTKASRSDSLVLLKAGLCCTDLYVADQRPVEFDSDRLQSKAGRSFTREVPVHFV